MQSSSVVRGSIQSECSLPLMRSVIGTAPSMFGPALVGGESLSAATFFAGAGTYAATKLAATRLPEVKRILRRVGFGGRGLGSSSDIGPPFESKRLLKSPVLYDCRGEVSNNLPKQIPAAGTTMEFRALSQIDDGHTCYLLP